ncbi:MAG TPA: YihY/virulence factor BrkB family protein [Dehalococcoidia bacterium]|nr:YihY/virulence factor BrkB family protein [Dehalococcoidia bacterium]
MNLRLRSLVARAASSPRLVPLRNVARLLLAAARGHSRHGCSLLAAAISYYVMFSLFPLIIFAAGVTALVLRDADLQRRAIDAILEELPLSPTEGRQDLEDLFRSISGPTSGGLGLLGLVGSAWSASNMLAAVRRSLDVVFETPSRPLVRAKLTDFAAMAALGLLLLASIALSLLLVLAQRLLAGEGAAGAALDALLLALSFLLPLGVSLAAFLFLFVWVPAARPSLRQALPGAAVAALLFEVAKNVFGIYVRNFANFDVVFGSLGAVAAFLFWVYLSATIMLYGAEVVAAAMGEEKGPSLPA